MEKIPDKYIENVKQRSYIRYVLGYLTRLYLYLKYLFPRVFAIARGAKIGQGSIITWGLALKANSNLNIGNDCIVQSANLDLRSPIFIESHVIINRDVCIIRLSHYIDDTREHATKYYQPLIIESYSWLATGCKILPSVKLISEGSIIGAFAVMTTDSVKQGVYSGNRANLIRKHNSMFSDLIVISQMGGDFFAYKKARYL